jgi:uncharacterized protein YbaP (TraB family)
MRPMTAGAPVRSRSSSRSALPAATAKRLDAWVAKNSDALQKAGIPGQMLQMFEPWFVGLTVSVVEMGKQGLDPKLGLDLHFTGTAQAANKPTSGLETGDEQIAFVSKLRLSREFIFCATHERVAGARNTSSQDVKPRKLAGMKKADISQK